MWAGIGGTTWQCHVLAECLRRRNDLLADCGQNSRVSTLRLVICVLSQQLVQRGLLLPS